MGKPKAELRVGGTPILSYLLDRFRWPGLTLLVTAPGRERPPGAERFTREVTDPTGDLGPLRGVLTALETVTTEIVVFTTCDMPRLEARQLAWLATELSGRAEARLVMTTRTEQLEPFPLAIRRNAGKILSDHFARGARSIHSLAGLEGAVVLAAPDDWPSGVWTNLNTPEDFARFVGQPDVS